MFRFFAGHLQVLKHVERSQINMIKMMQKKLQKK